jgi:hypothetical protein
MQGDYSPFVDWNYIYFLCIPAEAGHEGVEWIKLAQVRVKT